MVALHFYRLFYLAKKDQSSGLSSIPDDLSSKFMDYFIAKFSVQNQIDFLCDSLGLTHFKISCKTKDQLDNFETEIVKTGTQFIQNKM